MSTTPIADHALLSDRHSSALVTRGGSVDWLAFPRFDSPSVFGRLLGDDAGHWQIAPAGEWDEHPPLRRPARWCWRRPSPTTTGTLVLTDALAIGPDNGGHRLGIGVPHLLVRRLACTARRGRGGGRLRARGPSTAWSCRCCRQSTGGVTARGGAEWLVLTAPGRARAATRARRTGSAAAAARASRCTSALHRSTLEQTPARVWSQPSWPRRSTHRRRRGSPGRALHQPYDGPWADLVHHSGRVLQGAVVPAQRRDRRRRRPRRCPRASAASATGTTATPGCATPASPWRRCGWPPARTRRTTSSPS